MPVLTKSISAAAEPADGLRLLTTRYWPRGVRRERVDRYSRLLAPSRELLSAFRGSLISWKQYEERYIAEIEASAAASEELDWLAAISLTSNVTLICVCRDDQHCHRRLLKQLVEARR